MKPPKPVAPRLDERAAGFLGPQDRILWEKVVQDVRPLHPSPMRPAKAAILPSVAEERRPAPPAAPSAGAGSRAEKPLKPERRQALHAFDPATRRKIARGRMGIEARVDLHGLTQDEAYTLLLHFLQSAQHRGLRHVLVITGKGSSSGSDGALRQAVPHWLATAPFRLYVNAFEDAARHHGGAGALYVKVRRVRL